MKSVLKANKENLNYLIRHFWPLIIVELLFAITSGVSGAISSYMSKTFVNSIINDKSLKLAMSCVAAVSIFVLFKNIIQSIVKVYSNYVFSKVREFSKTVFLGYTKQLNLSFFDIPENKNCLSRADQDSNVGTEQGTVKYFSQKRLCKNEVQRREVRRGGCQAPLICPVAYPGGAVKGAASAAFIGVTGYGHADP